MKTNFESVVEYPFSIWSTLEATMRTTSRMIIPTQAPITINFLVFDVNHSLICLRQGAFDQCFCFCCEKVTESSETPDQDQDSKLESNVRPSV